jgi:uncharacterized RDD family membrane protein YckC
VAYLIDIVILLVPYLILFFISKPLALVFIIVFGIAYFVYFEGGPSGQTIGKRAMGIRVVDYNTGGAIGYGRGFLRYIGRIVSGAICYIGYLWMLWDREKQTWHDKIATTVVVPTSAYPVQG